MASLKEQQKRLSLNVINYDLEKMWGSNSTISELRKKVNLFLPKDKLYDPQDLEHQTLFRLTTFDPKDITDEVIQFIIEEQLKLIENRVEKSNFDLEYLFRGLKGKYHDLNVKDPTKLCLSKIKKQT